MKTADNHFRGFPALWNAAAFYLFLLHPSPALGTLAIAGLIVLTFVPIHVIHPVRVTRARNFNLVLIGIWAVLAIVSVIDDFNVGLPVRVALCAIGLYVVFSDAVIRLMRPAKA
jgi:phosphatidylcholine synthase